MAEVIGWGSSLILLLTIARQIHKQWRDKTSAGVSVWLFVGQLVASSGFVVYSILVGNKVFIVTNTLMAASAIAGWAMVVSFRRKGAGR